MLARFLHPDDFARLRDELEQLFASNQASEMLEKRLIRLDGEIIHIEARSVPLQYKCNRSVQLLFRDITDRKKASI